MVLSGFYWGYAMTQVLGGYLSDRVGGEIVLAVATIGWSTLTFLTPFLVNSLQGSSILLLYSLTFSRVLIGCFQGDTDRV